MKNQLLLLAGALVLCFAISCKPKNAGVETGNVETASPDTLRYEVRRAAKRHCVNDEQCADFTIFYLTMSGNNAAMAATVRSRVQARTVLGLGGNPNAPVELAIDSMGNQFIEEFIQLKRDQPKQTFNQSVQVTSNVLLNTPRIMTTRVNFYSFTGGAHPNIASVLQSFDLQRDGAELGAADLLSDTSAVLPMLEKAFLENKMMQANDDITKLLSPGLKRLPLPASVAVARDGIWFVYNEGEVAPRAVGSTDILLRWEQLGQLADKSKWLP